MLDLFAGSPAAEEIFRFMEQKSSAGLFAYDLRSGVLKWSPGMYALFEIREGSVEPSIELFRTFVHPQDRIPPDELQAYISSGLPFEREVRIVLRDGRTRWLSVQYEFLLDERGTALRMLGLCMDVTGRRAMHASLIAKQSRFKNLVMGVAPIIWVSNSDGLTTQAYGWSNVTGRADNTALGMDWVDGLHVEDRDKTLAAWRAACESRSVYERQYRVITPRGDSRLMRATAVPVLNDSGLVVEWNGIVVDVSTQGDVETATGAQIRAARGLLKWSVAELSDASGISAAVIRRLEEFEGTPPRSETALAAVVKAFGAAGVEFVFAPGELPGVRPHRHDHGGT